MGVEEFLPGPGQPLSLDGSTGCPPGSSGAGQKVQSGARVQVVAGVLQQPTLWGELSVPKEGMSFEDVICPFLVPVGREKEALI